jgi:predicted HAD superfamily Cof-like phosphohydrolase
MSQERLTTRDIARKMDAATDEPRPRAVESEEARALSMFAVDEAAGFRTRWEGIQTGFVDEPRKAVEEADALVAQVIKRLSEVFADERTNLEHQWDRGDESSTEELRVALRRYRSFFDRLLTL